MVEREKSVVVQFKEKGVKEVSAELDPSGSFIDFGNGVYMISPPREETLTQSGTMQDLIKFAVKLSALRAKHPEITINKIEIAPHSDYGAIIIGPVPSKQNYSK